MDTGQGVSDSEGDRPNRNESFESYVMKRRARWPTVIRSVMSVMIVIW